MISGSLHSLVRRRSAAVLPFAVADVSLTKHLEKALTGILLHTDHPSTPPPAIDAYRRSRENLS
jgi:hypothetical protein